MSLSDSSSDMSHADVIQKNLNVLLRCTDINLPLIDFLRVKGVLDDEQEHELKTEVIPVKQRFLLFKWLKEGPSHKYRAFLKVMKDSEQEHVAKLLTGNTEGRLSSTTQNGTSSKI